MDTKKADKINPNTDGVFSQNLFTNHKSPLILSLKITIAILTVIPFHNQEYAVAKFKFFMWTKSIKLYFE